MNTDPVKASSSKNGVPASTVNQKDVDRTLTQAIRTLREARATWQNFQAAPKEVGTIVATQLEMLVSRFGETARIIKSGGGR